MPLRALDWWFGVTAKGEGWFPSAYVQIEELGSVPMVDSDDDDNAAHPQDDAASEVVPRT